MPDASLLLLLGGLKRRRTGTAGYLNFRNCRLYSGFGLVSGREFFRQASELNYNFRMSSGNIDETSIPEKGSARETLNQPSDSITSKPIKLSD